MKRIVFGLVYLSLALWLGGLVTLFLAVSSIFRTFGTDRATAGMAAADVFAVFERYQLVLGAVLIVSAFWLRMLNPRRLVTVSLGCIVLAYLVAIVSIASLTPRIRAMRDAGNSNSPEFGQLHGISMGLYSCKTLLLLVPAIILPGALSTVGRGRETASG